MYLIKLGSILFLSAFIFFKIKTELNILILKKFKPKPLVSIVISLLSDFSISSVTPVIRG